MLDIEALTDLELTVLFKGVSLINHGILDSKEKEETILLRSELTSEINKRMIETTDRWK